VDPTKGEDWLSARKAVYLKYMKSLAVVAIALNTAAEAHYRQITSFRLPSAVAPVVSYLAGVNAVFFAGGIVAVVLYLNERSTTS
jgi:hypothetical protein